MTSALHLGTRCTLGRIHLDIKDVNTLHSCQTLNTKPNAALRQRRRRLLLHGRSQPRPSAPLCPPPNGLRQALGHEATERSSVSEGRHRGLRGPRGQAPPLPLPPLPAAAAASPLIVAACAGFAQPSRRLERAPGAAHPAGTSFDAWLRARGLCAWRRSSRATARLAGHGGAGRESGEGLSGVGRAGGCWAAVGRRPRPRRGPRRVSFAYVAAQCAVQAFPVPRPSPRGYRRA